MGMQLWLSDAQWATIDPNLPKNQPGAQRTIGRQVIPGVLHMLKGRCRWGGGPEAHDLPITVCKPLQPLALPQVLGRLAGSAGRFWRADQEHRSRSRLTSMRHVRPLAEKGDVPATRRPGNVCAWRRCPPRP